MFEKKLLANQKRIQQIRIRFPNDYPPYAHMNPHMFLAALNEAVKDRYDIQFIHVRYLQTKNKMQRDMNEFYQNQSDFKIDKDSNNLFTIIESCDQGSILKDYILKDARKLEPPPDYNPEIDEKKLQKQKQMEEEKHLKEIYGAVKQIMKLYNDRHDTNRNSIRAHIHFLINSNREEFSKNQYEIYAKGITHQPVIQKLEEEKNSKKPIEIKTKSNVTLKLFLHPTKISESISKLKTFYKISNWGLSTLHKNEDKSQYFQYFGTKELETKANKINSSVKLLSSISFNEKQNGSIQSFSIMTFLWNQIILKVTVKLAQICKIEKVRQVVDPNSTEQKLVNEYYFYLTYPPMFFISILNKEQASNQSYIRNWDRVQNFVLLDNIHIQQNYFLRYFLFNNSIIKVNCQKNADYNVNPSIQKIENLIQMFKGTIQTTILDKIYQESSPKSMKQLGRLCPYNKFLKLLKNHPQLTIEDYDKIWKIKYLLLVMARYNYLMPHEINHIINHIGEPQNIDYLDCYLYILWKTATNMWGYNNEDQKFYDYFLSEFENIKKMQIRNLLNRMMKSTDLIIYIFRVSLTPSGYLINPPTPQMKGRLMKEFSNQSEFFLRVSLNEENEIQLKNQKYITKMMFRKQMSQIKILDRQYIPLGWSPSQLRSFSLWYFHEIQDRKEIKRLKRDYILSFLGEFDEIQNPAKKAARIGQSFSSSWTYDATKIKCQNIQDEYCEHGYLFTDGVGKISGYLLQMISLRLSIRELSVIQMRYKGAKGVLALDPSLQKNTIQLRPSMIKFKCTHKNANKYLDILDWNKYKAGYLNRQIIILLKTLGIENALFIQLQKHHIKNLSQMTFKDCSIFKHLNDDLNTDINNLEPANKTILDLLKAGFVLQKQPFFRGVLQTLKKNGYHQLKVKSNILVENAARIIGIIDEYGVLEENQIYCSVHDPFALEPVRKVVEGQAIITRNPCLHPADIRIVRGIGNQQIVQRFVKLGFKKNGFEKFVNCVIFPRKGKYPLTAQISGSDLDGDNFFVCWDERLIPKKIFPINLIDEASKVQNTKKPEIQMKSTDQVYSEMLDFFINYTNYEKLGQIDNSHLVHADSNLNQYANDAKCMKLSQIHGKAVDFPKTGYCPPVPSELFVSEYPDFMEKQNSQAYFSQSILGILYRQIKQKIQNLLEQSNNENQGHSSIDSDLIDSYKFDQTIEEVRDCLKISEEYEKDLQNLIHLIGVDSQYEIYSGNFSTVKNKVKTFGKNRLISSILNLRDRYFTIFFQNLQEDKSNYLQCPSEEYLKKKHYFTKQAFRKAQLMYLVTYMHKYKDLKIDQNDKVGQEQEQNEAMKKNLEKIKEQIDTAIHEAKITLKQGKFCGFIWFVIPKVIVNLKVTTRFLKNKILEVSALDGVDNQEDKKREDFEEDDYDDGEL